MRAPLPRAGTAIVCNVTACAMALLGLGGCEPAPPPYVCTADLQCTRAGVTGQCLPVGNTVDDGDAASAACALPDQTCSSLLRWDDSAPAALAGSCVADDKPDLAMSAPALPDLLGVDLTPYAPGSQLTGAPCNSDDDCTRGPGAKTAVCVKTKLLAWGATAVFQDGYCESACHHEDNNFSTEINPRCPGHGTCSFDNLCVSDCQLSPDCRPGYVCGGYAGINICVPQQYSQCDPTKADSCDSWSPGGSSGSDGGEASSSYVCTSLSPDNMAGECDVACDVFNPTGCAHGEACYINEALSSGIGTCFAVATNGQGNDSCSAPTDCGPGFFCISDPDGRCRPYCRTGGDAVPCPAGPSPACSGLDNFDPDVVGICTTP